MNFYIHIFNSFNPECISNIISKNAVEIKKTKLKKLYRAFVIDDNLLEKYSNLISDLNSNIILSTMTQYNLVDFIFNYKKFKIFIILYIFVCSRTNMSYLQLASLNINMIKCLPNDAIDLIYKNINPELIIYYQNILNKELNDREFKSLNKEIKEISYFNLSGGSDIFTNYLINRIPKAIVVIALVFFVKKGIPFIQNKFFPSMLNNDHSALLCDHISKKCNEYSNDWKWHDPRVIIKYEALEKGQIFKLQDDSDIYECEPIDILLKMHKNWIDRRLQPWYDIYQQKPIVMICAHGTLDRLWNPVSDVHIIPPSFMLPTSNFEVPQNTQIINFNRAGNFFAYGANDDIERQLIESFVNPEDNDKYLFQYNGIHRKIEFPMTYFVHNNEVLISENCQKLYREGDYINDVMLHFEDHNGALFKPPFFIKGSILIFLPDNNQRSLHLKQCKKLRQFLKKNQNIKFEGYNDSNNEFKKYLDSYYPKFNHNTRLKYFEFIDGTMFKSKLSDIVNNFGPATYFLMSCKSSSNPKLTRAISQQIKTEF